MSREKNFQMTKAMITEVTAAQENNKQLIENSQITGTSRLLFLSSKQADINHSPLHKTWIVPDFVKMRGAFHKVNVRSANLWHLFKNVPTDVVIVTDTWSLPIYAGNWTAQGLANYISYQLKANGIEIAVAFDCSSQKFTFCPGIALHPNSTANSILGFPEGDTTYRNMSPLIPNLSGPTSLHLMSNLIINNISASGRLSTIPVNVGYGEMIQYENYDFGDASLSMDNMINSITLEWHDQDMQKLDYEEGAEWEVVLSFQLVANANYQPLQQ